MTRPLALVVEADDGVAIALDYLLDQQGFRVGRLAGVVGTLERVLAERPALVLVDADLPDGNGHALCQRLRAQPALSATRLLLMSAHATAAERRKCMAMGAHGLLAKPFSADTLRAEVVRVLPAAGDAP